MKGKILRIYLTIFMLSILGFTAYRHEEKQAQSEKIYHAYQDLYESLTAENEEYHSLPLLEKWQLRPALLKQFKELVQKGWSKTVIKEIYIKKLSFLDEHSHPNLKSFQSQFLEAQKVGSPLFRDMWHSQVKLDSTQNAKKSLAFLTHFINLPKELSGNTNETRALLRHFDANLSPTDAFWTELASLVQIAFPDDTFSQTDTFSKQIHQLRYVISAQQANWVRQHYRTKTDSDADALAKYLTKLPEQDYSLTESSRYHNKVAIETNTSGRKVPKYSDNVKQSNFKVLIHFHSEFILSESGQFLNEIDTQTRTKNSIVNSASFNYANQNDNRHRQLDITPINDNEPKFALKAMIDGNSLFVEPSKKQQRDKHNKIFSRKGKSSKQLTKEAAQKFQNLIKSYQIAFSKTTKMQ